MKQHKITSLNTETKGNGMRPTTSQHPYEYLPNKFPKRNFMLNTKENRDVIKKTVYPTKNLGPDISLKIQTIYYMMQTY